MQCRYDTANFLQNPHDRHPIAHPWGRDMGCLLWEFNSDIHFASVTVMVYAISFEIGPCYNGIWLYINAVLPVFWFPLSLYTETAPPPPSTLPHSHIPFYKSLNTVETPYSTIPYTTIFYITRWTHGPQNLQRPIRTLIVLLGFLIKQIFV